MCPSSRLHMYRVLQFMGILSPSIFCRTPCIASQNLTILLHFQKILAWPASNSLHFHLSLNCIRFFHENSLHDCEFVDVWCVFNISCHSWSVMSILSSEFPFFFYIIGWIFFFTVNAWYNADIIINEVPAYDLIRSWVTPHTSIEGSLLIL